ncbi:MAG: Phosphoenolpyruvate-dihydroxyacetone phosphotransferase, ADP-binding subunit DhaL, partial [uncultured Rubrobacteraceae bacterium]
RNDLGRPDLQRGGDRRGRRPLRERRRRARRPRTCPRDPPRRRARAREAGRGGGRRRPRRGHGPRHGGRRRGRAGRRRVGRAGAREGGHGLLRRGRRSIGRALRRLDLCDRAVPRRRRKTRRFGGTPGPGFLAGLPPRYRQGQARGQNHDRRARPVRPLLRRGRRRRRVARRRLAASASRRRKGRGLDRGHDQHARPGLEARGEEPRSQGPRGRLHALRAARGGRRATEEV